MKCPWCQFTLPKPLGKASRCGHCGSDLFWAADIPFKTRFAANSYLANTQSWQDWHGYAHKLFPWASSRQFDEQCQENELKHDPERQLYLWKKFRERETWLHENELEKQLNIEFTKASRRSQEFRQSKLGRRIESIVILGLFLAFVMLLVGFVILALTHRV